MLFDQAFRIFFRKRGYLDKLLRRCCRRRRRARTRTAAGRRSACRRRCSPASRGRAQAARDRGRRALHRVRPRGAAEEGLRADDRGRDRAAKDAIKRLVLSLDEVKTRRLAPAPARPPRRYAPHAARQHEGRRRGDRPEISRAADAPAADRGAARYFRLDEPVHAAVPAFPPRGDRRAQARAHVPVRHAADQRHPALKAKDPDEALAAVGASVADWSGGTRIATSLHAFNKLWARRVLTQGAIVLLITDGLGARSRRPARLRDRPAAPLLPAADLAQPAAALFGLRGQGPRHPHHAAACRRIAADPQSGSMTELVRAPVGDGRGPAIRRLGWRRWRDHISRKAARSVIG